MCVLRHMSWNGGEGVRKEQIKGMLGMRSKGM